jgi:lipoprotein-anchoring transpeptidase ErfK/SrfK
LVPQIRVASFSVAPDSIQIRTNGGAGTFTNLRDWWTALSARLSARWEQIMSANLSGRLCGACLLFAGVLAIPAAPAAAQALSYGPANAAPVYGAPDEDEAPAAAPALQRQVAAYGGSEAAGTIIIDPAHTFLYLTLGGGRALRYGIGVGRQGFEWSGVETITRKAEWPDWIPPSSMVARQPYLPRWVAGGPGNPLGARALYLGHTDYRIHGTNDPSSIGKHMSSGCIRMLNQDVIDLFTRVAVGAKVIVLPDSRARQISYAAPGAVPARRAAAHVPAAAGPRAESRNTGTLSGVY